MPPRYFSSANSNRIPSTLTKAIACRKDACAHRKECKRYLDSGISFHLITLLTRYSLELKIAVSILLQNFSQRHNISQLV